MFSSSSYVIFKRFLIPNLILTPWQVFPLNLFLKKASLYKGGFLAPKGLRFWGKPFSLSGTFSILLLLSVF